MSAVEGERSPFSVLACDRFSDYTILKAHAGWGVSDCHVPPYRIAMPPSGRE